MSSTTEQPTSHEEYRDPQDFYIFSPDQPLGATSLPLQSIGLLTPPASATLQAFSVPRARSADRSPTRRHRRRGSSPSKLQNPHPIPPRSSSNLSTVAQAPQKNIKDLVQRFNQDAGHGERPLVPPTLKEKHKKAEEQRVAKLLKLRSPVKTRHPARSHSKDTARMRPQMHKLEIPGALHQSVSYDGFLSSASPKSPAKRKLHQPAFGEVAYNAGGVEDLGYGVPVASHTRRGSDGSILKGTVQIMDAGSSQDSLSFPQYSVQPNGPEASAKHSRSYSDQSFMRHDSHQWSTIPVFDKKLFANPNVPDMAAGHVQNEQNEQNEQSSMATMLPTQPPSHAQSRQNFQASSERRARTPVNKYHKSTRKTPNSPTPARRYDPKRPESPSKSMKVYISAAPSQKSPPLRSSRPRQPVSQATTAASRARASERFAKQDKVGQEESPKQKHHRKIPELVRVDFAERRARIERALSQNLDDKSDFESRGSRASSRRRSSAGSIFDKTGDIAVEDHRRSVIIPTLDQVAENPLSPLYDGGHKHTFESLADHTTGDTDFEEDEPPDSAVEQADPKSSEFIQAIPMEFSPLEDIPHTNGYSSQDVLVEDLQSGMELSNDMASTGAHINAASQARHSSSTPEPSVADKRLDSDDDAALYRPRTPVKSPMLNLMPDDSDATPRPLDSSQATPDISFGGPFSSEETAETFMQRAIRVYEESGHIDPVLLQELDRRGLTSSGPGSTTSSDVATIQVLLDRFTFHPPTENSMDGVGGLPSVRYKSLGLRSSMASGRSHQDIDTTSSSLSRSSYAEWRDDDVSTNTSCNTSQLPGHRPISEGASDGDIAYNLNGNDRGPMPPPKDEGYSARSSARYSTGVPSLNADPPSPSPPSSTLKRVSDYSFSLPEIDIGASLDTDLGIDVGSPIDNPLANLPPQRPPPNFPPPAPPSNKATSSVSYRDDIGAPHMPRGGSGPPSPQFSFVAPKDASADIDTLRPSDESQRADSASIPASQLSSTFSQLSFEASSTDNSSPTPVEEHMELTESQRRISKRRNTIKELVDTEYSYHRDIKIIEDIYKATCNGVLSADDKKVLFGNADQIEALSLDFYDAIRRAVSPFYVVQKSARWVPKRASVTNSINSDKDPAGVSEISNEATNEMTAVGAVFEEFLPRMEKVYGNYLRNHEAANKRLAALQNDSNVSWWLKACHQNASDITSAWDLDSLLVKPVQRFLKYPLLLQQLLVITPPEHPDHDALARAVEESTNISHRMNEAKKRADLVESIVNRKRKDSELRAGIAKAFGIRSEKVKERIGMKNDYQDPVFDELSMKFGGHYIRLQVVMRDVQGSLTEVDAAVGRFKTFAQALEQFMETKYPKPDEDKVPEKLYPHIERKWRVYIAAIRELASVALTEHKEQVQKRVIDPMITALKLHEGPQNAMAKRKKRIVDHVRCQQMEKSGQKPDKKILEGSELYVALNEQLKIDLPKLYELSAELIRRCLVCHHQIQLAWLWTWEMKLRPILHEGEIPDSFDQITPQFHQEYDLVYAQLCSLEMCNGTLLAEVSQFLSPQISHPDDFRSPRSRGTSSRTQSIGSEHSMSLYPYGYNTMGYETPATSYQRSRASSQISVTRGRANSVGPNGQPAPRGPSQTPTGFSGPRPPTSSRPSEYAFNASYTFPHNRLSAEVMPNRSPRPASGTSSTYHDQLQHNTPTRYSGMYSSAMPMADGLLQSAASMPHLYPSGAVNAPSPHHHAQATYAQPQPNSPKNAMSDRPVMWVAVSRFQFNIDRTRREAGFPYLVYNEGEIFDVVAAKGELWLARNQDDPEGLVGWIWEQHFIILDREVSGFLSGRGVADEEQVL